MLPQRLLELFLRWRRISGAHVGGLDDDRRMGEVFIGSEAADAGPLNDYLLRMWYRTIFFRDVYIPQWDERIVFVGPLLWSRRQAAIATEIGRAHV